MLDRKIRLLVLDVRWPMETFIYNLLENLTRNDIKITIFTSIKLNKYKIHRDKRFNIIHLFSDTQPLLWRVSQFFRLLSIKILKSPKAVFAFWKKTTYLKSTGKRLYFFLHKLLPLVGHRFDIIHFQWNSSAIQYLPFFELFKSKIVISCRGSQINIAPYNPKREDITERLLKESFKKADAIHCVSQAIKEEVLKYIDDEKKIYVIRPAVDTDFFHPQFGKRRASPIKIVSVGSLIWRKGYEYALLGIKKLIDKGYNLNFSIVGEGGERQRILYTIYDLEIEEYVGLLGYKSQEEIRKILLDSDIFLLTSLSEGMPNAVIEAMACSLPVVTTACDGMDEAINDGIEGFIVPIRDTEAIAEALRQLIEDAELRQRIGQNGRERVINSFTLREQIHKFVELYNKVYT